MKTIFLATDPNCWIEERLHSRTLGGAENFFLLLREWLLTEGYQVFDPVMNPSYFESVPYDLVIHSNSFNPRVAGNKHLLWTGSWHAQGYENVDKTIVISEFMKQKKGWGDKAVVIPAPFSNEVLKYERHPIKGRIVTTSNPNRFLPHAVEICKILDVAQINYEWIICGGNRLYGPGFNEAVSFEQYSHPKLHYRGPLERQGLIALLGTAHLWVYPNFTDRSETQCVAIAEAMALEIPCIVPDREPFKSVYPVAFLASSNSLDFANEIVRIMEVTHVEYPGIENFSEEVVMPQILDIVKELLQ